MRHRAAVAVVLVSATTTCAPSVGPDESLISAVRIVAVRADPAEAAPGTPVTFTAFVAGPSGPVAGADIAWSFCSAPKPLTEDNVVSNKCLDTSSLVGAGRGPTTTATLPEDACSLFGPDISASTSRPADPDSTGGYYQPLRADLAGTDMTVELARIHCALANAPATAASAFAASYTLNLNPQLLTLTATVGGAPANLEALPAGTRVILEASWPSGSAETFAYFDPVSQTVTTQRESMQVAWYVTGGALDTESTGRASDDPETSSDDAWNLPEQTGRLHLWVVLRDSRGGVDVSDVGVTVVP
jgi:hypothetical protein